MAAPLARLQLYFTLTVISHSTFCYSYEKNYLISSCIAGNETNTTFDWNCHINSRTLEVFCDNRGAPHFTKCYITIDEHREYTLHFVWNLNQDTDAHWDHVHTLGADLFRNIALPLPHNVSYGGSPVTCNVYKDQGCTCSGDVLCARCFPGGPCYGCLATGSGLTKCDNTTMYEHRHIQSVPDYTTSHVGYITSNYSICDYCTFCLSCSPDVCGDCNLALCGEDVIEACTSKDATSASQIRQQVIQHCNEFYSELMSTNNADVSFNQSCSDITVCEYCVLSRNCDSCDVDICQSVDIAITCSIRTVAFNRSTLVQHRYTTNHRQDEATKEPQVVLTNYTLCTYCSFCSYCTPENCGDCDVTLCNHIGIECTCHHSEPVNMCHSPPCMICQSSQCRACVENTDIGTCLGTCQWALHGIGDSYKVAYHVEISGLAINNLEDGIFHPLAEYLESIYLEIPYLLTSITAFDTRSVYPRLWSYTLNHSQGGCTHLTDFYLFRNLELSSPYVDVSVLCPSNNKGLSSLGSSLIEDINTVTQVRKLRFINMFSTFMLELCSLPYFFLGNITGRELWISPSTSVECVECDSQRIRQLVEAGKVGLYQYPSRKLLECDDGASVDQVDLPCDTFTDPVTSAWSRRCASGTGISPLTLTPGSIPSTTPKLTSIGANTTTTPTTSVPRHMCPETCNCNVSYFACSTGPIVRDRATYFDIYVENYYHWYLQTIQEGYLRNLTQHERYAMFGKKALRLSILSLPALQTIEVNAFTGFETICQTILIQNNTKLTKLPKYLLKNFDSTVLIDVTANSIENIKFLMGLKSGQLSHLYLNSNKIVSIHRKALAGLFNLQVLRLHDNNIVSIDFCEISTFLWTPSEQNIFARSQGQSRLILDKSMTLGGNRLVCDCSLAFFRRFTDPVHQEYGSSGTPIRLLWEEVDGVDIPTCSKQGSTLGLKVPLTEFIVETSKCVNPRKLSCGCQVPDDEIACGCGYCANGGSCNKVTHSCDCTSGYSGPTCEVSEESLPRCGSADSLMCRNGALCVDNVCDCAPGWIGVECDITVACTLPYPCDGWQTCISLLSLVDASKLSSIDQTFLHREMQCLDIPLLVEQISPLTSLHCSEEDNSACEGMAGSVCTLFSGEYVCMCPLHKPYQESQHACVEDVPLRCHRTRDCYALEGLHVCTSHHQLEHPGLSREEEEELGSHDHSESTDHFTKYCHCIDKEKRNLFSLRCNIPVEKQDGQSFLGALEWKLWHVLLIIGCVTVTFILVGVTVGSYGRLSSGFRFDVLEERLRKRFQTLRKSRSIARRNSSDSVASSSKLSKARSSRSTMRKYSTRLKVNTARSPMSTHHTLRKPDVRQTISDPSPAHSSTAIDNDLYSVNFSSAFDQTSNSGHLRKKKSKKKNR